MMGADFGYRVMGRVTTVLFLLAGLGVLSCAAFFFVLVLIAFTRLLL